VRYLQLMGVTIIPEPAKATDIALLDSLATAVLAIDSGLNVRYLNIAAEQLLSISHRKAIGQRLTRAINIPDSLFSRIREAIESGHSGLILEISVVDRPLRIARDEAMMIQQEHASSLVRGLAHEIKNPLGGLRGAAQLLARQLPEKELKEYTSIIIREADRLQSLIDRMLGPTSQTRRDIVNLHEVLEHVRKIILAGATDGIDVRFDYDPSIPECITDRDRFVQVLLNIAGNALQALKHSGQITFRSRVVSSFTISGTRHPLVACIEIIDDGPGVPSSLIDQIFFPMVTGNDHGTGLGLSIAQTIMNQLGGFIECSSEPGNTIFTVLLPMEIA